MPSQTTFFLTAANNKRSDFHPTAKSARAWRLGGRRMRVALVVLSLATLASCLFTAKAGGAAEVDCSVCFANETLDVTAIPTNDTGVEEA